MATDVDRLRETLVQAVDLLFSAGVMQASGHGNMSVRLDGERMLLGSTGRPRRLTADDLALVTFDGEVLDGRMDPGTREIVGMHACVYRARPGVGSVIHTHSPSATSFALAHEPLPCVYEALLRFGVAEDIPVAAWAPRGSREAVAYIVEQLERHPDVPAVLLANHGLLAFGEDPLRTAYLVIAMEEGAGMALGARALGGPRPFPPGALEREREHMRQFGSIH
ncbi:MAG: class II aldolase/adducin family protein [Thermomicrobiaceae bacterium]|nr:class II aldolase/adducin family protein [Thermomicrobiaceae bacterium]